MFNIQDELKKLPVKPGVYIMKDEGNEIIYIGKAVVLKNRVRQYFQASANHTPKTRYMITKIKEFEFIVTDSELEALILECTLIKKHRPRYNILLKDDKNFYPYIKITMNEDYPRVLMTRKIEKDGARYFGPYHSAFSVKETLEIIRKIFPIKTCNKVFPRDIGKERPCLNFYIFQCMGPCRGDVNKEQYRTLMKDIGSFLDGRHEDIIKRLESDMKVASEALEFEKAASIRDKISSLKRIAEKQKVLSTSMEDQDVIGFAKDQTDSCVQVFFVRGGKLSGRAHFMFEEVGDISGTELMSSFIEQFYTTAAFIPPEIIVQEGTDENEILEKWLSEKRNAKVHIRTPKIGEKLKLVEMVAQNAVIALNQFKERTKKEEIKTKEALGNLVTTLGLQKIPLRIEAYDVSNTGTSEIVASMIVFENGKPNNKEYRKFKIKSVTIQNDYASMQEVIFRRLKHAQKEKSDLQNSENSEEIKGDSKFSKMPDLILLDGGLGHVNAVQSVINELNEDIPLYGMVKDEKHHTRGLVSNKKEYKLSDNMVLLRFITSIQDEAHRFAVGYNKKLREKRYTGSALDEIEGIGPKRKKALIKHFGSVGRLKTAGIDDIMAVEGISQSMAEKIYNYFN